MSWRFSDPHTAPYGSGRPDRVHLGFDQRLGRWRWAFKPAIDDARRRVGRDLTGEEAAVALAPELGLAFQHIAAEPPDATVFGTIYVTGADRVTGGNAAKAKDSRKHAEVTASRAADPSTPDFLREGLMLGAAEVIYDVLRDYAPNALGAATMLVRCFHSAHDDSSALAEWADRYCRVYSAAIACGRLPANDPVRAAVLAAYQPDRYSMLTIELESDALQLGVYRLFDPAPLAALPVVPMPLDELASYIQTYEINWLNMVCQTPDHMGYFQLGPGTLRRLGESVHAMVKMWKGLHLATFPPRMKEVMIHAAVAANQVLVKPLPYEITEIRVAACQAMGKIPMMETLDLLRPHAEGSDSPVKTAASQAILDILATLGIG
jgi:hypothetical protein